MAQRRTPARTAKKDPPRVGAIFARRLREARNARRWTQQDLADAVDKLGAPMDRTVLARLEKGQREVRLDELVALAAALDVAIVHLILPIEGDITQQPVDEQGAPLRGRRQTGPAVALTPTLRVNQRKARRWARGEIPLRPASFRLYADQSPGDILPSAEELSPAEQQALNEENQRLIRKLGIRIQEVDHPAKRPGDAPTSPGMDTEDQPHVSTAE
ncbi:MAG TPA: helix-turn-helix domain-containing protein [Solirubrobacteraceae bacterium]|nr:helix-turn-helix domain-containing protein [Solirubrobacteraceae bacterium]